MHDSKNGLLSQARMLALETSLTLMKSAPLVHVRRQAVVGLSAACVANPQLIGSRCVAEAIARDSFPSLNLDASKQMADGPV